MSDAALSAQYQIVNAELHKAVESADYDRIDLCLQKGADINAHNSESFTPLMRAVQKKLPILLEHILSKKPNLLLKDEYGRTVFDFVSGQDDAMRKRLSEMLFQALPNAQNPNAQSKDALAKKEEQAENFNDVSTREGIRVGKPLVLAGKKAKAPDDDGFKL